MARERKTIEVEAFRIDLNARIANPKTTREERKVLCFLLSDWLMAANRYRGFRYLDGWNGTEDYRHEYY